MHRQRINYLCGAWALADEQLSVGGIKKTPDGWDSVKKINRQGKVEREGNQYPLRIVGDALWRMRLEVGQMPYRPNTPCRHPGCAALVPCGQK